PGLVQSIILTRISGRTKVPESEELSSLAAHRSTLCLYLSAKHIESAQQKLLQHYPVETPVAICFRLGWSDEKIRLVPLSQMAEVTQQENLVRTTMYVISPALSAATVPYEFPRIDRVTGARSQLYHPNHDRLFRDKN
ncbi:precorrin-4 C(11)-methyltransferase, partial [Pseudanabaenaceae cyanobacterium LEGE 13415]|nr:precorrin-4 C(11)-methyltransferase [Pseudanabaenaceae cyanobacterium LEGE 13415]